MTNYKDAYPSLDKFEGGLVFIKSEGQWTNKGIQYSTYNALCFQLLKVLPTIEHFKRITRDEWGKFVQYYWNIATFNNSIIIKETAVIMFTAYWGSGNKGLKKMQEALRWSYYKDLGTDGVIGQKTVDCINKNRLSYKVLFSALNDYWMDLASQPKWAAFKNGWTNRLNFIDPHTPKVPIAGAVILLILLFLKLR